MVGVPPVVLLVDRSADDQELYSQWLTFEGFCVVRCDGIDAAKAQAASADLVVTGIGIASRDDGIAFVKWLRSEPATRHKPIVVLTAYVGGDDEWRAVDAGCDRFLPKPCLPETLQSTILELLGHGVSKSQYG